MKRFLLYVLALLPFIGLAQSQAVAATYHAKDDPKIVWLFAQAADYWRSQSVVVPPYRVIGDDVFPLQKKSHVAAVSFAPDGQVLIIADSLGSFRGNRAILAQVALHEMVHVAQRPLLSQPGVMWSDEGRRVVEEQAESLSYDHLCSFMARVWGKKIAYAECSPDYAIPFALNSSAEYARYAKNYRALSARMTGSRWDSSAARFWRLRSLQSVSRGLPVS